MEKKSERLKAAKKAIAAHWAEHGKAPVCAHVAVQFQLQRHEVMGMMKDAAPPTPSVEEELTERQEAALIAIAEHWASTGKAPTCASVARIIGIKRSGAQRLMDECRDKGYAHGPVMTGHWELSKKGEALLRARRRKEPG